MPDDYKDFVDSNAITINVKDNLWSDTTVMEKDSDAFKTFIYDCYFNLYENLNRIKQLQLFSIENFSEDSLGNQWFVYKPKFKSFTKTDNSLNLYNVYDNDKIDDVNLAEIKASDPVTNPKNVDGELWIRLKNFPFAYPVQYVTSSLNNTWTDINDNVSIRKAEITGDFGYVCFYSRNTYHIIYFKIDNDYNRDNFIFSNDNQTLSRLDKPLTFAVIDGVNQKLKEVPTIKKTIPIVVLAKYSFKDEGQFFIDSVYYNSQYYLFFGNNKTISENQIYLKRIPFEEQIQYDNILKEDAIIELPEQNFGNVNICTPNANANWSVSMSANDINIAYEAAPYA